MIFCNTKKTVDEVTSGLLQRGFVAEALHGDMKQLQRERVMARFKNKQVNILVASDVAARGLDINDVDCVFNYDLPQEDEYYVHRIGRTGRAKKEGVAISLISGKEIYRLKSIIKYTKVDVKPIKVPSLDNVIKSSSASLLTFLCNSTKTLCTPKESILLFVFKHFLSILKPCFFNSSLICFVETFPNTLSCFPTLTLKVISLFSNFE